MMSELDSRKNLALKGPASYHGSRTREDGLERQKGVLGAWGRSGSEGGWRDAGEGGQQKAERV